MSYSTISILVIDANLAVRALFPVGEGAELKLVERWRTENRLLFAPELWLAETTSVIRRMACAELITAQEAKQGIQDIFALEVQVFPADAQLCLSAYEWAEKLGQSKAYDGFYLALAERLSQEKNCAVEFWTADKRLFNRATEAGVSWVRQP